MTIDVIIPSWNGRNLLGPCLAALAAQTRPADGIVVVDNGSTDDTAAWIAHEHPHVKVIPLSANAGFAGAAHAGAESSHADCIAFLNNDARPHAEWLAASESVFQWGTVGACAALILTPRGAVESAGLRWTIWGVGRTNMHGRSCDDLPTRIVEVFGPSGGAAVYRRHAYWEAGGFDSAYFAQDEDIDLAVRLRYAGYSCLLHPGARVVHLGGQTLRRTPARLLSLAQRNLEWAFWRNTPLLLWPFLGTLHVAYQAASLIRHAAGGRASMVARAKYEALITCPALRRGRPQPGQFVRRIAPWLLVDSMPWRLEAEQRR